MPNLSALLNATISLTDTTITPNPTVFTRNLNNPTLALTQNGIGEFFQIGTGASPITFPPGVTLVYIVYVKNLHATNNVLVTMTPNGGASNNVGVVGPGGVFLYFQTTETAGTAISGISNGISAVSLTASAAATSVEVMVGA